MGWGLTMQEGTCSSRGGVATQGVVLQCGWILQCTGGLVAGGVLTVEGVSWDSRGLLPSKEGSCNAEGFYSAVVGVVCVCVFLCRSRGLAVGRGLFHNVGAFCNSTGVFLCMEGSAYTGGSCNVWRLLHFKGALAMRGRVLPCSGGLALGVVLQFTDGDGGWVVTRRRVSPCSGASQRGKGADPAIQGGSAAVRGAAGKGRAGGGAAAAAIKAAAGRARRQRRRQRRQQR